MSPPNIWVNTDDERLSTVMLAPSAVVYVAAPLPFAVMTALPSDCGVISARKDVQLQAVSNKIVRIVFCMIIIVS